MRTATTARTTAELPSVISTAMSRRRAEKSRAMEAVNGGTKKDGDVGVVVRARRSHRK
jgi:hypothetical protein